MLKLEAGKRYWRRDAGVSGRLVFDEILGAFTDGHESWYADGRVLGNKESPFDLIREFNDPQLLEWKRGIPTEEECRECWIVGGGNEEIPESMGVVLEPGRFNDAKHWTPDGWYLPLRIKPVEAPKPKMVRKWTLANGAELWWPEDDPMICTCWIRTDEVRPS